jgi:hypothetical protein
MIMEYKIIVEDLNDYEFKKLLTEHFTIEVSENSHTILLKLKLNKETKL